MEITQEKIELIELLVNYLHTYNATGRMKIDPDHILPFKRIYMDIYRVTPNTGCITCVLHYLNQLQAFLEREKPKWIESQQPVVTVEEQKEVGCSTCKKKPAKRK